MKTDIEIAYELGKEPTGTIEELYEALLNFNEDGFTAAPPPKHLTDENIFSPSRGKVAKYGEIKAAIVKAVRNLKKKIREYNAETKSPYEL